MDLYLSLLAAAGYLTAARCSEKWPRLGVLALLAFVVHGALLLLQGWAGDALRLGFASMLSVAMWVCVAVYAIEAQPLRLGGLGALILPSAALAVLLPYFFPGQIVTLAGKPAMFPWHLLVATLAYSTLTLAAFHAALMSLQERHLHQRLQSAALIRLLDHLPALLSMERILFRLIGIGFALLCLTVLSGVLFSEEVLGVAFSWSHKTLFSLLSWALFGILLAGRALFGWRGKTVLRFTLGGFVLLLLAYVGSRFVLEVILHRSFS